MSKSKLKPYLFVLGAVLLWSTTASVSKLLLKDLNNIQVLFYTSCIASISLLIITLIQKKGRLLTKYTKKDHVHFALMGFLGVFLYYLLLFGAFMYSTAQEAFIVNYTWPVWVMIFAVIILKEKMSAKKILAIVMGFIGVYVVVSKGNFDFISLTNVKGNILALAGAISYGAFSVLGKKFDYERITSTMFYYIYTFLYICIITFIFASVPHISLVQFAGLLWLGIFTSGLAFVFWFFALKHGDTAKMSNIVFLTPFISLVWIRVLTGEAILWTSLLGLGLIIAGILFQNLKFKK